MIDVFVFDLEPFDLELLVRVVSPLLLELLEVSDELPMRYSTNYVIVSL